MKTLKINKQKGQFYYNFKGNEFISNWGRKENQFEQVDKFTETDLRSANDELKETLKNTPVVSNKKIDFNTDIMTIELDPKESQFYILKTSFGKYLIDNQGYDYPRYITKLEYFGVLKNPHVSINFWD